MPVEDTYPFPWTYGEHDAETDTLAVTDSEGTEVFVAITADVATFLIKLTQEYARNKQAEQIRTGTHIKGNPATPGYSAFL